MAYVADTLPVQIKLSGCRGYAPVNLHDTFIFRDAIGHILARVDIGGCPTPVAYLRTTQNRLILTNAINLDAAALEALGLPTSYGL